MKDSYIFYKEKLEKEYLDVFEQVEWYALAQNVDSATREERLGELLDIFLSAQEAERPVSKLTGGNALQFCRAFCSDFGMKHRILGILDWFKTIAWFLFVVSVLDILGLFLDETGMDQTDFWSSMSSMNLSGYFIGCFLVAVIGMAINIITCHIMFRKKKVSMKLLRVFSLGGAVLSFAIILLFLNMNGTRLFDCPAWVVLVCCAAYLLIYYPTRGKQTKKQKIKFSDLVHEDVQKELTPIMEKKYEKARKKSLKKGKGELTMEAFLDKEERDCDRAERLWYMYYIFPGVLAVVVTLCIYMLEGFESYPDMCFFLCIVLVVIYPIELGIYKVLKNGMKENRAWVKAKREELEQEALNSKH